MKARRMRLTGNVPADENDSSFLDCFDQVGHWSSDARSVFFDSEEIGVILADFDREADALVIGQELHLRHSPPTFRVVYAAPSRAARYAKGGMGFVAWESDDDVLHRSQIQNDIDVLAQAFGTREYADVKKYLHMHSHVIPVVFEARQVLSEVVPEPTLRLEILKDYDSDDEQLYVIAQVPVDRNKAIAIQDEVDGRWWIQASASALGDLNIVVEPIPVSE